jgi:hypothetical protein
MDVLWSPWRMEYILGPKPDECIFCLPEGRDGDEERFVLYRGKTAFVIMNKYPYTRGYRIFCGAIFEKMMFSLPCSNSIFTLACCLNRHAVEVNDVNTRDGKLRLHICALGMNFVYKYRKKRCGGLFFPS